MAIDFDRFVAWARDRFGDDISVGVREVKINSIFHFGGVKAPRRALGYFTIITFYDYNGYPILLEFVFSSVSQRSFTRC